MSRCEIEADPWACAWYIKVWNELKKAWKRGNRNCESESELEEDTKRADKEYFDLLTILRQRDSSYKCERELERDGRVSEQQRTREHVELQLANPELRRLYVARRGARARYDFFTRKKQ